MKRGFENIVEQLSRAREVVRGATTVSLCLRAMEQNEWLSVGDIDYALNAICDQYLAPEKVAEWLAHYPTPSTFEPKVVGVVAAGNIPLAAFFDIFCVVVSGHRCRVKFSSKDAVLMPAVCEALARELGWPIEPMTLGERVDALIASGSDTAMESIGQMYGSTPTLLRGHRSSVALLDGTEGADKLSLLAHDIFRYNSMGCRNVTLVFMPETASVEKLIATLHAEGAGLVAKGYTNNYRQAVATAMLTGANIISGGHFVVEHKWEFPLRLAQVNIATYTDLAEAEEWIARHDSEIQCVVTESLSHPRKVPFGEAQRPTLTDWPDGVDVMQFLQTI